MILNVIIKRIFIMIIKGCIRMATFGGDRQIHFFKRVPRHRAFAKTGTRPQKGAISVDKRRSSINGYDGFWINKIKTECNSFKIIDKQHLL